MLRAFVRKHIHASAFVLTEQAIAQGTICDSYVACGIAYTFDANTVLYYYLLKVYQATRIVVDCAT